MGLIGQKDLFGKMIYTEYHTNDLIIKPVSRDLAHSIIKANHYSRTIVNNSYAFYGLYFNGELVGVSTWGYAMNPSSAKNIVSGTANDEYMELNRLWVDDIMPRNTESQFISGCIKLIKHHFPKVGWVQSFADERCRCKGVIYQACNFVYVGSHKSMFVEYDGMMFHKIILTAQNKGGHYYKVLKQVKDQLIYHEFEQYRYIYFINQRLKDKLLLPILPYPKQKEMF